MTTTPQITEPSARLQSLLKFLNAVLTAMHSRVLAAIMTDAFAEPQNIIDLDGFIVYETEVEIPVLSFCSCDAFEATGHCRHTAEKRKVPAWQIDQVVWSGGYKRDEQPEFDFHSIATEQSDTAAIENLLVAWFTREVQDNIFALSGPEDEDV
jgi:hypothetical protein